MEFKYFAREDIDDEKWEVGNWKYSAPYRSPFTDDGIAWQRDLSVVDGNFAIYFIKKDKNAFCSPQANQYHRRKFLTQSPREAKYVAYIDPETKETVFWYENGKRTGATDGYEAVVDHHTGRVIHYYVRGSEKRAAKEDGIPDYLSFKPNTESGTINQLEAMARATDYGEYIYYGGKDAEEAWVKQRE